MNDRKTYSEDDVMALARELPTDVQPPRDLWQDIEAAIGPEGQVAGRRRWPRLYAQAAAVLLMIGASSGLTWLAMQDDAALVSPVASDGLTFEPVSGSFGREYMLGPDFQDARQSLASRLDAELERLPPDTRAEVEKNMATIRAAITEINKALAEEPGNVLLQELLISSYTEELAIMRKVDGIANTVMHRTDI